MSRALGIRRPLSSCLPAALVLAVAAQLLLLAAPAAADKQGPSMSLRESLMKVRAGVLPGPRPAFVDGSTVPGSTFQPMDGPSSDPRPVGSLGGTGVDTTSSSSRGQTAAESASHKASRLVTASGAPAPMHIQVTNDCADTFWLTIKYHDPATGWRIGGWYELGPGERAYLADTDEQQVYLYAETVLFNTSTDFPCGLRMDHKCHQVKCHRTLYSDNGGYEPVSATCDGPCKYCWVHPDEPGRQVCGIMVDGAPTAAGDVEMRLGCKGTPVEGKKCMDSYGQSFGVVKVGDASYEPVSRPADGGRKLLLK